MTRKDLRGLRELPGTHRQADLLGEARQHPGKAWFQTHGQVLPGRRVGPNAQEGDLSL